MSTILQNYLKKLVNNKVFFYILLCVYIEPPFINYFSFDILSMAFACLRTVFSCIWFVYFFSNKNLFKDKKIVILFSLFLLSMAISGLVTDTLYLTYAINLFNVLMFFLINIYMLNYNKKSIYIYFKFIAIYILVHIITFVLFPQGLNNAEFIEDSIWFLGKKNTVSFYILPFLIALGSITFSSKKIILIVIILFMLFNQSSTALICLLVLYVLIYLISKKKLKINSLYLFLIFPLFLIYIVLNTFSVFGIYENIGQLITFNGRIEIWCQALSAFLENPLFGNGINYLFSPWTNGIVIETAHNSFLELLSKFGIVSFSLYFIFIAYLIYQFNKKMSGKNAQISVVLLFIFLLNNLFETVYLYYISILFYAMIYALSKQEYHLSYEDDNDFLFTIYIKLKRKLCELLFDRILTFYYTKRKIKYGINKNEVRDKKIIVTLTSYPLRFDYLYCTISSLLNQTLKPDKILLYIFKNDYDLLPRSVLDLEKMGLTIVKVDQDLKSHKKYYYSFMKYRNDLLITVDDDIIYSKNTIKNLVEKHYKFPNSIIASRVHKIKFDKTGSLMSYNDWDYEYRKLIDVPSYELFCTTGAGALFCPDLFKDEIFNKDVFIKYALSADDVWIKIMSIISKIPVVCINKSYYPHTVANSQKNTLNQLNVFNNQNDIILHDLLNIYSIDLHKKITQLNKTL